MEGVYSYNPGAHTGQRILIKCSDAIGADKHSDAFESCDLDLHLWTQNKCNIWVLQCHNAYKNGWPTASIISDLSQRTDFYTASAAEIFAKLLSLTTFAWDAAAAARVYQRDALPTSNSVKAPKELLNTCNSMQKQAVGGRPLRYAHVRHVLRPSSSPYTPYAWPAAPSAPCFQ